MQVAQISGVADAEVLGASAAVNITGVVEQVSDGDTLTVRGADGRLRVRLLGIDTPELNFHGQRQSPWAEQAWQKLQLLAPRGARVRLITDRQARDQYGRLLAYVFVGQRNVNLELVRAGWAVAYQIYPNLAQLRQIQAATAAAETRGLGIFSPRNPLPLLPYEFRQRVERRPPNKYCGDTRTRRYYPPREYQRVPIARRVFFYTAAEARTYGYSPALAPASLPPQPDSPVLLADALHRHVDEQLTALAPALQDAAVRERLELARHAITQALGRA